jgi:hypothetical protein
MCGGDCEKTNNDFGSSIFRDVFCGWEFDGLNC